MKYSYRNAIWKNKVWLCKLKLKSKLVDECQNENMQNCKKTWDSKEFFIDNFKEQKWFIKISQKFYCILTEKDCFLMHDIEKYL